MDGEKEWAKLGTDRWTLIAPAPAEGDGKASAEKSHESLPVGRSGYHGMTPEPSGIPGQVQQQVLPRQTIWQIQHETKVGYGVSVECCFPFSKVSHAAYLHVGSVWALSVYFAASWALDAESDPCSSIYWINS